MKRILKKILVLLTVVIYTMNFSFNVSAKSYNVDDELSKIGVPDNLINTMPIEQKNHYT